MKKDYTLINCLLDRSGSMQSTRQDAINGFNSFVEDQAKLLGEVRLTLCQFDDQYEILYCNKPLSKVPKLTYETFIPRGCTALLDGMGKMINQIGENLTLLDESQRPDRVIFLVVTDGQENASRNFSYQQISDKVEHQRTKYNWQFIFIGSNMDAVKEASKLGFDGSHTLNYIASSIGTQAAYNAVSNLVGAMRRCAVVGDMATKTFSNEDRKKQEELLK